MTPLPTRNSQLALRRADYKSVPEMLDYAARGETGITFYNVRGEILSALAWREVPGKWGWWGIGIAVIAVVLIKPEQLMAAVPSVTFYPRQPIRDLQQAPALNPLPCRRERRVYFRQQRRQERHPSNSGAGAGDSGNRHFAVCLRTIPNTSET